MPVFRAATLRHPLTDSDPTGFQPTLPSAQVRTGRLTTVDLGPHRLVLTRINGQACAFNSLCPHQLGNLASGLVHQGAVECPVHGWRFDLATGRAVYPESEMLRLRRYAVREADGLISVRVQSPLP